MAANTRKRGGNYCRTAGPNKVSCKNSSYTSGISMHYFPKNEAVRKKWMNFVRKHRKDFVASQKSCLCSAHFDQNCYKSRPIFFPDVPDIGQPPTFKRYLIKGSFPTKDTCSRRNDRNICDTYSRVPVILDRYCKLKCYY